MSIYIGMKNGMTMDLDQKLNEIRQDLIYKNGADLSNRREFFTRKYRGNRLNDVNVGIWDNVDKSVTVQIFLRNKEGMRREQWQVKYVGAGVTSVKAL
jgi:hypothetical protein